MSEILWWSTTENGELMNDIIIRLILNIVKFVEDKPSPTNLDFRDGLDHYQASFEREMSDNYEEFKKNMIVSNEPEGKILFDHMMNCIFQIFGTIRSIIKDIPVSCIDHKTCNDVLKYSILRIVEIVHTHNLSHSLHWLTAIDGKLCRNLIVELTIKNARSSIGGKYTRHAYSKHITDQYAEVIDFDGVRRDLIEYKKYAGDEFKFNVTGIMSGIYCMILGTSSGHKRLIINEMFKTTDSKFSDFDELMRKTTKLVCEIDKHVIDTFLNIEL